jgi:CRP-like cAMP-binding protein
VRITKFSSGCVFGEAEFFLNKLHSLQALALVDCVIWTLDRR